MDLKVLLVDDELLIRLGIKSIIHWEQHGFQYIGDAPDGQKALEMMEKELPDIVLTDIVMPRMDGLALIETVKKRYPQVKIVVLSSHNEYDYLRRAMKLGVEDYLLKASMKPEELLDLLQELAKEIRKNHQNLQRQIVKQPIVEDKHKSWADSFKLAIDQPKLQEEEWQARSSLPWASLNKLMIVHVHKEPVECVFLDKLEADSVTVQEMETTALFNSATLRNLLELELHKWVHGAAVIPFGEQKWVLFIPLNEEQVVTDQTKLIAKDLISASKRFLNMSISIAISRNFSSVLQMRHAYVGTMKLLQNYFYDGKEKVYEEREDQTASGATFNISKEEEGRLKQAMEHLDEVRAMKALQAIFERMEHTRGPIDHSIQACLKLLHLVQYDRLGEGSPLYKDVLSFEVLAEAKYWFEQLLKFSIGHAKAELRDTYREEIMQLLLYMKSNFKEELSLKQAAEVVSMSQSYLSYLFKKEMNVSFTEYLNQLRVERAAELLIKTDLPSYQIAEEVGYDNSNYFGRVFKKIKGVSPQQYRNQH